MANAKLPPFITWRKGRPRFIPGAGERDLGFRGEDLRHRDRAGAPWLSFEEACAWGAARHAEILAARAAGRRRKGATAARRIMTLEDLLRDWLSSDAFKAIPSPRTREGYRKQVDAILLKPQTRDDRRAGRARERESFAAMPVTAIEPPEANGFIEYQIRTRGLYMGRASRAVLVQAFRWGRTSTSWRLKQNPFAGLRFKKPDGRIVIWSDAEIRQLVDAADALGLASVGDSILLGLFTGQRQGDRLSLCDDGLIDGRRQFRQSKTGAIVAIPETPRLRERLEQARARVRVVMLKFGTRPDTIVVFENTGRDYRPDTYRHNFETVRAAASLGMVEIDGRVTIADPKILGADFAHRLHNRMTWLLQPMPSCADKRDQDLRDTSVTWLARASCTVPEIAAITGHEPKSIYNILTHYLAITPELADAAIGKLVTWMDREGITV